MSTNTHTMSTKKIKAMATSAVSMVRELYHPDLLPDYAVIGKVKSNILVFIKFSAPSFPRFDHSSWTGQENARRRMDQNTCRRQKSEIHLSRIASEVHLFRRID
jgi:hypothetical protein